jgi:hypothetical protein
MNPFDLNAALLAKHAQHPVIIHFSIVAFDLLAIWRSNPTMAGAILQPSLCCTDGANRNRDRFDGMAMAIGRIEA